MSDKKQKYYDKYLVELKDFAVKEFQLQYEYQNSRISYSEVINLKNLREEFKEFYKQKLKSELI